VTPFCRFAAFRKLAIFAPFFDGDVFMRARKNAPFLIAGILLVVGSSRLSQSATGSADQIDPQLLQKTVEHGVSYLINEGQAPDGSYSAQVSPAVTAICTAALLRSGRSPDDPAVAKSLKYLEGFVQKDGGIYRPNSSIQNYETSIAIMCFVEANKDGRYTKLIKNAENYVKNIQWGGDGSLDRSDIKYGGAGYGSSKTRPDLSNTSFLLDALQSAGADSSDEAVQRAMVFVSRCQNLETKYNTTPFAAKNPDGGFYYTPADGGKSAPGGTTPDGGLSSYGSMTYAGLKSMIFAGLTKDDERVKAATEWVKKHYTLEENPGLGQRGVFYAYHSFAKALNALGNDEFADAKGVNHHWKAELVAALAKRQQANGAWVNSDSRFDEGDPNLVTSYALLTLSYCKPLAK
jgi:squalene-hopene/tetraprenyl-beta-curcumene cyclase